MIRRPLFVTLIALGTATGTVRAAEPLAVAVRSNHGSTTEPGRTGPEVSIRAHSALFDATIGITPCLQPGAPAPLDRPGNDRCPEPSEASRSAYRWNTTWTPPPWIEGAPRLLLGIDAASQDRARARKATAAELGVVHDAGPLELAAGFTRPLAGGQQPTVYANLGWRVAAGGRVEFHGEKSQGQRPAAGWYGVRYHLAARNGARWELAFDRVASGPERGSQAVLAYVVPF